MSYSFLFSYSENNNKKEEEKKKLGAEKADKEESGKQVRNTKTDTKNFPPFKFESR